MPNSTEKTMLILRCVSDGKGNPVSLEKIATETGINKSTASHIVSKLTEGGYLQKISHTLGYTIGAELHLLTRYGRYGEEIIRECHPILEYLSRKSGHTAVFSILSGSRKYIIDRVSPEGIYTDESASIISDDIYRTVTGRVLLAHIPRDQAMSIYGTLPKPDSTSWQEATSLDGYLRALSEIKGLPFYSIKSGHNIYFWHSFACPIYKGKKFIGAIGLAVRTTNDENCAEDEERYADLMIKCKRELERRLNFT